MSKNFDESKVKRRPKGDERGGEFANKYATNSRGGKIISEKAKLALKTRKACGRDKHMIALEMERYVHSIVGGKHIGGLHPVDIEIKVGGVVIGVEVKTLIDQTNDKITIKGSAIDLKKAWARRTKGIPHIVAVDTRGGGKVIYHAYGFASYRLSTMTRVTSMLQLRKLIYRK